MLLCCGVTREELKANHEHTICVDLLVDGGTSDHKYNIFYEKTWQKLLRKYGENAFTYIFIDGGMYGSFQTVDVKGKVMNILQKLCSKGIILYGHHLFLRFSITGVKLIHDLLERPEKLPFSYIPIEKYNMKTFDTVLIKCTHLQRLQRVRTTVEYYSKF